MTFIKLSKELILNLITLVVVTFLSFWINAHKLWDIQQIVFYIDSRYLIEHITSIGGTSEWITNLIGQFFFFRIMGNLILGLLIFSIYIILMQLLKIFSNGRFNYVLALIPPLTYLLMLKNPAFPLNFIFQILITLPIAWLFLYRYPSRKFVNHAIFALFFVTILYINSLMAAITFGLIVLIFDFQNNRSNFYLRITSILVLSLVGYLIGKYYLLFTPKSILIGKELFVFLQVNILRIYIMFLIVPVVVILAYLQKNLIAPSSIIINGVALTIFSAGVFFFKLPDTNILPDNFRYLAHTGKWDLILKKAAQLKTDDRIVNFYTNKALYYTGKLSTNLFDYPQSWGEYALLLTTLTEPTTLMDNSDLFYELGHIGAARYWAFEAQTVYENRPTILKRLAECNIIFGNYEAAKPFALKLSKSPIHRKTAEYLLKLIADTSLVKKNNILISKRESTPKVDIFLTKRNPESDLKLLVVTNPKNRMAYEYLQTFYLLHNDVNNLAKNICNLNNLGFDFLPPLYEEGILTLYYMKKIQADTICGYKISDDTKFRFQGYLRVLGNSGGDFQMAKPFLNETYGNTYWFYLHFISPITLKKEITIENE